MTPDPYLFPELNGSQGITGIVTGWMEPLNTITQGYFYFMMVFVTFFIVYQKVDNPMMVGLLGLLLISFLVTNMPKELMIYVFVFIGIALGSIYMKVFVKSHI